MADPTQIVQNQVGFAPELAPYAQTLLGQAQAFTNPNIPYEAYTGERVAQFTPLQQQSFAGAQNMQPSYQLEGASGIAGLAGQQALNTQYNPSNYQTQSITGGGNIGGGYGGGMDYVAAAVEPSSPLQQYMSPYVQQVIQRQQNDAARQAAIAGQSQQAQAARAGAFGGSGDYLMRAQAAGNLARQKGDIMATGMQNAYNQALQQFNTEQQQRQAANQLNEQSRQFGAGLGLQGLQTALSSANTLNTIGQNQFAQNMDINKLQNTYGGQQQQQMNTILGNQYQEYLNQINQPYKQMGFMSDIIRGAPLSQMGSTMYQAAPSAVSQIAGVGTAALGAKSLGMFKKGGAVEDVSYRDKPAGLADLAIYNMG